MTSIELSGIFDFDERIVRTFLLPKEVFSILIGELKLQSRKKNNTFSDILFFYERSTFRNHVSTSEAIDVSHMSRHRRGDID